MRFITLVPTLLTWAAVSTTVHGKGDNKPGKFTYSCFHLDCDANKAADWIKQACYGVGGHNVAEATTVYDVDRKVTGATGICQCARGQTNAADYYPDGDYPAGKASLSFGLGKTYGCQSRG